MDEFESLSHSGWECKYHIVFIPKYRRKVLYKQLRKHLGEVFHRLAQRKESQILEGHLMSDHVGIKELNQRNYVGHPSLSLDINPEPRGDQT